MKISIIVPSFNAERYIGRCVRSILLQSHQDFEVIIVDGRSKDGTVEIASKLADSRFRIISEPDMGQGDAVTKGLLMASGDIHHWHAADDIINIDAFAYVNQIFTSEENVGLVISDGLALLDEGKNLVYTARCRHSTLRSSVHFFGRFQSDCAYWRSELSSIALPISVDYPLTADEEFLLKIWAKATASHWCPRPLGIFQVRAGQLSQTTHKSSVAAHRKLIRSKIIQDDAAGMRILTKPKVIRYWQERAASFADSVKSRAIRQFITDSNIKQAQQWIELTS